MTADEIKRIAYYGLCSVHSMPRDVRIAPAAEGGVRAEMFCPACDAGDPWPAEALLRG